MQYKSQQISMVIGTVEENKHKTKQTAAKQKLLAKNFCVQSCLCDKW